MGRMTRITASIDVFGSTLAVMDDVLALPEAGAQQPPRRSSREPVLQAASCANRSGVRVTT